MTTNWSEEKYDSMTRLEQDARRPLRTHPDSLDPMPAPSLDARGSAMLRVRTILHPIDFADTPSTAFDVSCALARDYGAELVLTHIDEPAFIYSGDGMPQPIPSWLEEAALERLKTIRPADPRVVVRHVAATGNPVAEILRVAAEAKADLIVMGTHGRSGLSRMVMGSVAEGVLRESACPVVTVRNLPLVPPPEG